MSVLQAGRIRRGKSGICYTALEQINNKSLNVWRGKTNHPNPRTVILKGARPDLFRNELKTLAIVQDHASFRQLLDVIDGQEIMVLEHLAGNLHDVATKWLSLALERSEVKPVAKVLLQGVDFLHSCNIVHTDIKPNNILIEHDQSMASFSNPKLSDLGDSVSLQTTANHRFGAPIFRPPEALLGLPWSQSVDIWSFGVTLIALLTGIYYFAPPRVPLDDEDFGTKVVVRQLGFFGPFPEKYSEIAGPVLQDVHALNEAISTPGFRQKYQRLLETTLNVEDLEFLQCFMQIDPRDRPSAAQLLLHPWFNGV
ncbi:hypothetical protein FQN53_007327 [Emmonsiellopsis sp. PD_33]|nr:hypothetical protein FQN53_007327 [Emmonsiellopsis sp. PD_33]